MCWKKDGEGLGTRGKLKHGGMSVSQTPFEAKVFSSSQSPKEEGRLGYVASSDGRSNDYFGRGCAWIEKGPSTT
jgi:hypothetical protein